MNHRLRYALQIAAVAAAYFAAARVGLLAAVAQPVVSSAWPPSGVALAALLLLGLRLWPGVALGAFLLNWMAGVSAAGAAGIALGNTLEAVAAAWLLARVVDFRPALERVRDVIALVVVAALASTTLSATLGVASLWASGAVAPDALRRLWFVWWSGDALGDVLVAPLVLTWARAARPPSRGLEAAGLLAALLLLTALLLRNPLSYVYAVFPVVVWAALRFGTRGPATTTAIVAALTVGYTLRGLGPFVASTATENLALLQTFLGLTAVTGLVLAAVVTERGVAEGALEQEVAFVRLLHDVAVAANAADTAEHALQTAVARVCRVTGWPVGHVYLVPPDEPELARPSPIWHDDRPSPRDRGDHAAARRGAAGPRPPHQAGRVGPRCDARRQLPARRRGRRLRPACRDRVSGAGRPECRRHARVLFSPCHRARPRAARGLVPDRHAAGPRHRAGARRGGAARARSAARRSVRPVGRRHCRDRSQRPLHPQQPGVPRDDRIRRRGAPVSVARRHHVRGRPSPESRADGRAGARHPIILHVREALLPQGRPVDLGPRHRVGAPRGSRRAAAVRRHGRRRHGA